MMKAILILALLLTIDITAQTDWQRWKASDITYRTAPQKKVIFMLDSSSFGIEIVSAFQNAYYLLFSNYDGDNCPFNPTCSHFFVQAVKATNILQGALMFADRFTRDTNLFKTRSQYPVEKNGKLFDPIYFYELDLKNINLKNYFSAWK